MVDSILVSVDFSNKNDTGVMVVGRKRMNQSVEIINAFQGEFQTIFSIRTKSIIKLLKSKALICLNMG